MKKPNLIRSTIDPLQSHPKPQEIRTIRGSLNTNTSSYRCSFNNECYDGRFKEFKQICFIEEIVF